MPNDTNPLPQSPGQWPSVNASWQVAGTYPSPQLVLDFTFDTARYTNKDGPLNAAADAGVYCDLIARLTDTEGAAFSISSSLSSAPIGVTAAGLAALSTWMTSISQYLANIAASRPATPPPSPLRGGDGNGLTFPLSAAALPTGQIFELTCGFSLALEPATPATLAQPAIGNAGLIEFATKLEAAYAAPSTSTVLKVAAGPTLFGAADATSSRLWAVRVPASGAPLVFAPKPISRRPVTITSGTQTFSSIDLDQWVSELFGAVDGVLGDRCIGGLMILDKQAPGTLAALQRHKRSLAAMYAPQMAIVFTDQTAPNDSVVAIFEKAMHERLSNAYLTQAALQYTAAADAGALDGAAPLIVLATPPAQSGGTANPFVRVFGNGVDGASTWLRLVLSGDASTAGPAETKIPQVTRAYPPSPIMTAPNGSATIPQPTTLSEALEWTCAFTCSLATQDPHDVVSLSVVFNQSAQPDRPMRSTDSFAALAEFVTLRRQLQGDFDNALATLTVAAPKAQFDTALAAVQSFARLLDRIAAAPPKLFVAPRTSRRYASSTNNTYTCTLQETTAADATPPVALPRLDPGSLIVTVVVPDGGGPVPSVELSGADYITVSAGAPIVDPVTKSTTEQYYFTGATKPVPFASAQSLGPRTISYPGLQILALQDAQASAFVTRNQNLAPGRTTRDEFLYQTAEVTFPEPVRPALVQPASINVGAIASPKVPAAPRPLSDNLTALFYTLVDGASSTSALLQVTVSYQYPVSGLLVGIPILMQPVVEVSWAKGNDTLATMITELSAAITAWFAASTPAGGGQIQISLTVLRAVTEKPLPVVRLTSLDLALSDIMPTMATL